MSEQNGGGITERELELVKELVGAKLEGVAGTLNARMDGIEKWIKWGAFGIAATGLAQLGAWLNGTTPPRVAHTTLHVITQLVT